MPDVREKLTEQAEDILDKWEFFYGQRAGRELWEEKPEEVQNEDIEAFCRDLAVVRSAVTDNNVGSKWIPVTERKPQEFVSVLIYAPGEVPLPAVHEAYFARGCWVTHITVLNEHEVTHWMEMPELPKMEV